MYLQKNHFKVQKLFITIQQDLTSFGMRYCGSQ